MNKERSNKLKKITRFGLKLKPWAQKREIVRPVKTQIKVFDLSQNRS